jgi:PAS domain S-box-containing protein
MLRNQDRDKDYYKLLNGTLAKGAVTILPSILDIMDEAVCFFDNSFRLTWWNKAFEKLCSLSQLTGQTGDAVFYDLLNDQQKELFAYQLEQAKDGNYGNYEWECNIGFLKCVSISLHPLKDDEQETIGIAGVVRNMVSSRSGIPVITNNGNIFATKKNPEEYLREFNKELAKKIDEKTTELSGLLERITDAFIALDKDWNYTYLNKKAEELHGRKREELVGKNIWKEFPDVVNEPFYKNLQQAMETQEPVRAELYYSVTEKWYEDFIYPSAAGVSVYYRDITEKKKVEQDLQKSEELYRTLVEHAADAIIIADTSGKYIDVNSFVSKMTGYSKEELSRMNIFDLLVLGPDEPPLRIPEILEGKSVLQERKIRRKDGSVFCAELSNKLLPGNRMLIIGRDITERKRMQKSLSESEFKYRTLFEEGTDGVCFYNPVENKYYAVNKRMTELFGYSAEEFLEIGVTDITFHEDIKLNPPRFINLPVGVTATNERVFRKKDGTGIYIETTTKRLQGNDFISFMRDISERKKSENLIQENELRWKLAIEKSELGVWEMNFEKGTAFISEKTREQTGYYNEQDLANPEFWYNAIYKEDKSMAVGKFINTLKGIDPSFDVELRVVCKNGDLKWFRFTGSIAGRGPDGRALRIIGVHEHITERVMKEKDLRLKERAIESSISGIGITALDGTITYVNNTVIRMWGARDSSELIGKNLVDVFEGNRVYQTIDALQRQGYEYGEDIGKRVDGSLFPVEFTANVIMDEKGKPQCLYGSFIDISKRKDALNKLAQSETLFREITENSPSGIILLDKEHKFKFISVSARRITGYLDDNVIGLDPASFTHPDDLPVLLPQLLAMLDVPGKVFTTQYRFLFKDGSWHYLESTFSNLLHIKGVEAISVNFRDIHEEKLSQIQLRESEAKFRSFFEHSIDGIVIGTETGKVLAANKAAQQMFGMTEEEMKQAGRAGLVDTTDPLLEINLKERQEKGFAQTELRFIKKDGTKFPVEISSSVFKDAEGGKRTTIIFHDISERKRTEQRLKEFNERIQRISSATNDGIWEWDLVEDTVWWNEAFYNLLGYDSSLPVPELNVWSEKIHPDDRDKILSRLKRIRKNVIDSWQDDFRYLLPDGTYGTVLDRAYVIRNEEGRPVRVIGAFVDITERKRAEEKLANEKILSDSLINNLPGIFYLYTNEGKFLRWNKNFETLSGYSSEEIKKMHPLDFHEGAEKNRLKDRLGRIFKMQVPGIELVLTAKDKRNIPMFINSMAIIYEGVPCVIGIGNDITKRKKAEQDLIESEDAFQRLFEESAESILLLDGTHFIDCNESTLALLGYSSKEAVLNKSPWDLSPDNQPDGKSSMKKMKEMAAKALKKGYHRFEWVNKKADGTEFPVEVMLTPIIIKGQQLFYTIWHDITERKRAEEELRKSLKEISDYKYALDESATVSFADENGTITYVNDKFCKLYGYKKEEIVGQNHRVLNSGFHPASFWQHFWQTIKKGKVLKAEVCNLAKDGKLHWSDTTIIPFAGDNGRPYQYLAIRFDITEKRQLEEDLARQQKQEQIRITETALEAQEKERNYLGQELHDNVNQILVGTKLLLSIVRDHPEENNNLVGSCVDNLQNAIDENRKLSHSLVTPDLNLQSLPKQLRQMTHEMFSALAIAVTIESKEFKEKLLDKQRKIAIYRIAQEQCTNIIKYAKAKNVTITLRNENGTFHMKIADDGQGMEAGKATDGIGIRNIKGRVSIFGGKASIDTKPGKGFALLIEIPVK